MSVAPGSRLGPYEITGKLGEGGMGEVYRATDSKLKREVAIKVLPAAFVADRDRLARFEREAQLLAQLNHPHIAHVYGLETSGQAHALVMELVEGPTLAEKLAQGRSSIEGCLAIARQIAEALEAAHEKGIVHRDLKPQNVKLSRDGEVKVLDFGLAKAMEVSPSSSAASPTLMHSPTLTAAGTQLGVILGTAAYMAPEQARGGAVDKRADIWAFGVVLHEMLSGRSLFAAETVTDTLAGVIKNEIDFTKLPAGTPAAVRQLLRRCLERNPKNRMRDIGEARIALAEASAPGAQVETPAPVPERPRSRSAWPIAIAAAAVAALLTFVLTRALAAPSSGTISRIAHLSFALPEGYEIPLGQLNPLAITRDGSRVAMLGQKDGKNRIFIRLLSEPEATALEDTEGADQPFFSPDGAWIGFFAGTKLRRIATNGAASQVLADAPTPRGGFWGDDGFIYFAPSNMTGIWRVPEGGGAVAEVTHLNAAAGEISHRWPHRVAGTSTLLFGTWVGPGDDEHQVAIQVEGATGHRVLLKGGDAATYAAKPGLILYTRGAQLFTVPWKPSREELGKAVPVATAIHLFESARNEGVGNYSVSDDGTVVYLGGKGSSRSQRLVWVDAAGTVTPLPQPVRTYENVAISPDESRAAVQIREGTIGLWIYDFARGTLTPLTTGAGSSQAPLWTPDGSRLIYRGTRGGTRNLYWMPVDGSREEERLTTKAGVIQTPTSISADGRLLLFDENGSAEANGAGAWVVPLEGEGVPRRIFPAPAPGQDAQISPDGRWVAFQATVSSRREIFVAPFSGAGERRLVSIDGGDEPLWSRDGRTLYFVSGDRLMSVAVSPGATFSAGPPRLLHEGLFSLTVNGNTSFSVTRDGARFLRIQPVDQERSMTHLQMVFDWFSELGRREAR